MHTSPCAVSAKALLSAEPVKLEASQKTITIALLAIGLVGTIAYAFMASPYIFWGSFLTNLFFWTGIAAGSCVLPAIFSIVFARWAPPVRRIAEANSAFLPIAYLLFLLTFFGKQYIYPWANGPVAGREFWMEPNFVYARFAVILAVLFYVMHRYVRISLRRDIGLLREKSPNASFWKKSIYDGLVRNWRGSDVELPATREQLSWNGPLLILIYAVVYSLFAFEMLMSMDNIFYSNLFGAFIFCGNIFMAWAMLAMNSTRVASTDATYKKVLGIQQLWDIGKMNLAFTMIWGYMFFSQFLPYWYANIPETSQWMILRTREFPWMGLGYVVFTCCFIFPFVMFVSDDIKKNPKTYRIVAAVILIGMFLEKYILVIPQLSPEAIPFSIFDIAMFAGFFGLYRWRVHGFLEKYPYVAIADLQDVEKDAEHH